jgi:hypothetical protein
MVMDFLNAIWQSLWPRGRDTTGHGDDAAEALEGDRGLIDTVLQVKAWEAALADDAIDAATSIHAQR